MAERLNRFVVSNLKQQPDRYLVIAEVPGLAGPAPASEIVRFRTLAEARKELADRRTVGYLKPGQFGDHFRDHCCHL
jgi:hypothetical protein